MYKIKIDKEKCLGCGACNHSDNWEMDDNFKAEPVKKEIEELGDNQEVADNCPVGAIEIEEVSD